MSLPELIPGLRHERRRWQMPFIRRLGGESIRQTHVYLRSINAATRVSDVSSTESEQSAESTVASGS